MNSENQQARMEMIKAMVTPWHQAVSNPASAQETQLEGLLKSYNQTEYGRKHHSENVGSYLDFKKAFPVQTFTGFKPYIDRVMAGNTHALLSEEPLYIGYTKGTTGAPKVFPFTPTHAKIFKEINLRIIFNYSLSKQNFEWLSGYRLNLVSSANIGTIKVGEKEMKYGYSVAVAARIIEEPTSAALKVVPSQDEMDTLPAEATKLNWETRYEFAYQKAREMNVTYIMTTPNVVVGFGRYLYRRHHISPKDMWQVKYIMSGGFPNTHTRFAPPIHTLYGTSADIRESYVATEGAFGAQIDDKKAWTPFYDRMFFEVQTTSGIKQMHEMIPGEIGSLIVSTPSLPRYRIGDLILAFEPPYFRCIGRENTKLHPYNYGKLAGKSAYDFKDSTHLDSWR
jgi:phenylacetate-coenzyme A ligase PaaK-like adenylate-forming protein